MQMRTAAAIVAMIALTARGQVSERDSFGVFIQPGLEPRLTAQDVVPTSLPEPFGSIGLSGTIHSVERVGCARGSRLPEVDPCVSRIDQDSLVWVVVFRGKFTFNRWEGVEYKFHRGYYLVDDRSGLRFGGGTCPDT